MPSAIHPPPSPDPDIDQVRRFNRAVAEGIGAIDDHFLGRPRPLGESRLLWEIGPAGADIRGLRARLNLDSGYISRILGSLQRQGLVTVETDPIDRRVRRARLTESGLAERSELDRRSDDVATGILAPLGDRQRAALIAAMAEVERLLRPSQVCIAAEDPTTEDATWCIEQYFSEIRSRFDTGFDPAVSRALNPRELTAPAGALLIARLHGAPIGCLGVKLHKHEPAELKRMWVSPDARGLGLGRRLLQEAEQLSRQAGYRSVRLDTNRALVEAIALYRHCGYVEVPPFNDEPYAHHWFEKALTGS